MVEYRYIYLVYRYLFLDTDFHMANRLMHHNQYL